MKQKKYTKHALCMSLLSMLLCCSMLIGTTFAWFTDSVTSGRNKITAGNLDIELYHTNTSMESETEEKVTEKTLLFAKGIDGEDILWEPGVAVYESFTVKNEGSLALKYKLAVKDLVKNFVVETDPVTEEKTITSRSLTDVIKVAVTTEDVTRETVETLTFTDLDAFVAATGTLMPKDEDSDEDEASFNVVLYWQPSANDDLYNLKNGWTASEVDGLDTKALQIEFGVDLLATQYTYESDSFDDRYDEKADDNEGNVVELTSVEKEVTTEELTSNPLTFVFDNTAPLPEGEHENTTVEIEAGAISAEGSEPHTIELTVETKFDDDTAVSSGLVDVAYIDLTLLVDGEEFHNFAEGKYATITTYVQTGLYEVTVLYEGEALGADAEVTYDRTTGKLTFKTNHFSKYVVEGKSSVINLPEGLSDEEMLDMLLAVLSKYYYSETDFTINLSESDGSNVLNLSKPEGYDYDDDGPLQDVRLGSCTSYETGNKLVQVTLNLNGWTVYSNNFGRTFEIGDYSEAPREDDDEPATHLSKKANVTVLNGTFQTEGNNVQLVTIGERSTVKFENCKFITDGKRPAIISQEVGYQQSYAKRGTVNVSFDGCSFEKCYAYFRDSYGANNENTLNLSYTDCDFTLDLTSTNMNYTSCNYLFRLDYRFKDAKINMTGCEINYTGYDKYEKWGDAHYALCYIEKSSYDSSYYYRANPVTLTLNDVTINGQGRDCEYPAPFCTIIRQKSGSGTTAITIRSTDVTYNYNGSPTMKNGTSYWSEFREEKRG